MKIATTFVLVIVCNLVLAQTSELKSLQHGLDMKVHDIPKEIIIDEIRFKDGKDDNLDVIRFDQVTGEGVYPLIISSKLPIATDSLGILAFQLSKDTLDYLLFGIDNFDAKNYSRDDEFVLIRITYRYNNKLSQYYMTNPKLMTIFFSYMEKVLISNQDQNALNIFYEFVAFTGLLKFEKDKRVWKYMGSPGKN